MTVAAEGVKKNEWIGIGSMPISVLAIGFIFPSRRMG
jgi:hypothetical protein